MDDKKFMCLKYLLTSMTLVYLAATGYFWFNWLRQPDFFVKWIDKRLDYKPTVNEERLNEIVVGSMLAIDLIIITGLVGIYTETSWMVVAFAVFMTIQAFLSISLTLESDWFKQAASIFIAAIAFLAFVYSQMIRQRKLDIRGLIRVSNDNNDQNNVRSCGQMIVATPPTVIIHSPLQMRMSLVSGHSLNDRPPPFDPAIPSAPSEPPPSYQESVR